MGYSVGREFLTTRFLDVQAQTKKWLKGVGFQDLRSPRNLRGPKQILTTHTWKTNTGPCGCTHIAPISRMKPRGITTRGSCERIWRHARGGPEPVSGSRKGVCFFTPWAIRTCGLLHALARTHAHTLHAQSPDRPATRTSVSDPDLERVFLDTMGDQGSSAYCTREIARFLRTHGFMR